MPMSVNKIGGARAQSVCVMFTLHSIYRTHKDGDERDAFTISNGARNIIIQTMVEEVISGGRVAMATITNGDTHTNTPSPQIRQRSFIT